MTTPTRASQSEVLKVGSETKVHALAGSIAHSLRRSDTCEMQCVGAGAINQAIKGCAVARKFLQDDGFDLSIAPAFINVDLGAASQAGQEVVSGMQLVVRRHSRVPA
jgi:stage V sporulation protein SpoVS